MLRISPNRATSRRHLTSRLGYASLTSSTSAPFFLFSSSVPSVPFSGFAPPCWSWKDEFQQSLEKVKAEPVQVEGTDRHIKSTDSLRYQRRTEEPTPDSHGANPPSTAELSSQTATKTTTHIQGCLPS